MANSSEAHRKPTLTTQNHWRKPRHASRESEQPNSNVRAWLQQGLRAARAGDRSEAHRWFKAAREADPDNIVALLWLAWLAPTGQESLALLNHVLELDPKNKHAHAGIRWARRHPSSDGDVTEVRQLPVKETSQRTRHSVGPFGLFLVIAACLLAISAALVALYSPAIVLALAQPTTTPTVTPPLTFAPEPTATPTDTITPTPSHTPSPTPASTATNTPSLTPALTTSPPIVTATSAPPVTPSVAASSGKWIDIDLSHQQLTAYEGNTPVFQTIVSTGLPNTPTVVGQFRIYWKLTATDMAGPGYYLPGVPYTMYFYRGYALHGTYWHNNFGQPMSHGCVNLRTEDAKWIFNWVDPPLPAGATNVRSSNTNPGTLVVVHD